MAHSALSFVLLAYFVYAVSGHGWLTAPTPRQAQTTNSNSPCDTKTANSPAPKQVTAGSSLTFTWITPHTGGTCTISITTSANENNAGSWTKLGSFAYALGTGSVTIPASLTPGSYVAQWYEDNPGPYYNCVDLKVLAAPPTGSTLVPGSATQYQIPNGIYDASSGNVTCNPGYSPSKDSTGNWSCSKGGLSGGAGFGVFLLVLIVVCVGGFIGIAVYLKKRRPEKYDEYKLRMGEKMVAIKAKFSS